MVVTDSPTRLVYRRFQPAWWLLAGSWFVVSAVMYQFGPAGSHRWVFLVMGGYGIALYLAGPAAGVVVSRHEVLVRNVFVHWRVARSRVGAVQEFDWSDATMAIHGRAEPIDLTAFGSIGRGEGRKWPTRWTWLPSALDRISPLPRRRPVGRPPALARHHPRGRGRGRFRPGLPELLDVLPSNVVDAYVRSGEG